MFSDLEEAKMSNKIFLALAIVLCIQQVPSTDKCELSDYVEN